MEALPDTASDLIDVAVSDLETCNADPRYVIDMTVWHAPTVNADRKPVCAVCLAGAVIAQRFGVPPPHTAVAPSDYGDDVSRKLMALERFRKGDVLVGLALFYNDDGRRTNLPVNFQPSDPDVSFDDFCTDMRRLASKLRAEGL